MSFMLNLRCTRKTEDGTTDMDLASTVKSQEPGRGRCF